VSLIIHYNLSNPKMRLSPIFLTVVFSPAALSAPNNHGTRLENSHATSIENSHATSADNSHATVRRAADSHMIKLENFHPRSAGDIHATSAHDNQATSADDTHVTVRRVTMKQRRAETRHRGVE
jgi:hypothetical protein